MNARSLALLTLAAALVAPAATAAPTQRDTYHRYRVDNTRVPTDISASRARATASVIVPARWKRVSGGNGKGSLKLRMGHRSCTYTVYLRTGLTVSPSGSSPDAAAWAEERIAGSGPYLLDSGRRGSAAWRVVRDRRSDPRKELHAIRVRPVTGENAPLAPGQRLWHEVTAHAISRAGDECHSGSYRVTLGPALGDALATADGGGYALR